MRAINKEHKAILRRAKESRKGAHWELRCLRAILKRRNLTNRFGYYIYP